MGTDDPEELKKIQGLQDDFNRRKEDRLQRLAEMDKSGEAARVVEENRLRRASFQPVINRGVDQELLRKKQDEILLKMQEAKEQKRFERKKTRGRRHIKKEKEK